MQVRSASLTLLTFRHSLLLSGLLLSTGTGVLPIAWLSDALPLALPLLLSV